MHPKARRVWIEAMRELKRFRTRRIAVTYVVLVSALALFFGSGRHFEWYLRVVYLFIPLLVVIVGVRSVVEDHRRGFSSVAATTPLTGGEATLGKVAFLVLLLLGTLAPTLPASVMLTAMEPADNALGQDVDGPRFWRLATYAGLGFLVGLFSGVVGMLAGGWVARRQRSSPLVTYVLVGGGIFWFGLAALTAFVVLRPERATTPVQGVLELSPVALAFDAVDVSPETHIVDSATAGVLDAPVRILLLVSVALLLGVGLAFFSRVQGSGVPPILKGAAILGVVLVAGSVGSTVAFGETEAVVGGTLPVANVGDLVVRTAVTAAQDARRPLTLIEEGPVLVTMTFESAKGGSYRVERVCLGSRGIEIDNGTGCRTTDHVVTLPRNGRVTWVLEPFHGRIVAPDGDVSTIIVTSDIVSLEGPGLALPPVSLANPLGVEEARQPAGKPTRMFTTFLAASLDSFGAALLWRLHRRPAA